MPTEMLIAYGHPVVEAPPSAAAATHALRPGERHAAALEEVAPAAAHRASDEGLRFDRVSKRLGSVQALTQLSFSVGEGRMLGFLSGRTARERRLWRRGHQRD